MKSTYDDVVHVSNSGEGFAISKYTSLRKMMSEIEVGSGVKPF